jgi:hypothetical protein
MKRFLIVVCACIFQIIVAWLLAKWCAWREFRHVAVMRPIEFRPLCICEECVDAECPIHGMASRKQ